MDDTIKRLVVFAILMENNAGILNKSPDYVDEKYRAVFMVTDPLTLLDSPNLEKFKLWERRWHGKRPV